MSRTDSGEVLLKQFLIHRLTLALVVPLGTLWAI